jgi:hypothetical protein
MALIKSNSTLIAFDRSWLYDDTQLYSFDFLSFVQKIDFEIKTNKTNLKYIGNESTIKNQFVKPDINLQIDYYQKIDFLNEKIFGLILNDITDINKKYSFYNLINKNFNNKNIFLLYSDLEFGDLLYQIRDKGFNLGMIGISMSDVYLTSLSFSYKISQIPIVSTSFASSNMKIASVGTGFIQLPNGPVTTAPLGQTLASNLIERTQKANSEVIIYVMKNISISNTFSSLSVPGPDITSFLSGFIQSMDFSINLNRNKFYFFGAGSDPADRKIMLPIEGTLKITGISNTFTWGDLNTFFNNNSKFSVTIGIAGKYNGLTIPQMTDLIIDNLSVDSFSYNIDLNGLLNYTLTCSFENTSSNGLNIISYETIDPLYPIIASFDAQDLITSDSKFISLFNPN